MGRIKKGWIVFCCFLWVLSGMPLQAEETQYTSSMENISLYAAAAVLMDAESGRVLYEKSGSDVMAMASTTKIMTCITVLENGNLDDVTEISAYAASMPKVRLSMQQGEQYIVRDLLYSLMLESHNDSAVALAEYIGKSFLSEELKQKSISKFTVEESKQAVAAFAALMNQKARDIGCEDTWFITPNGLDATETITLDGGETLVKEHGTTAVELALIMAYCIGQSPKKEEFLSITRTSNYSFSSIGGRSFSCTNHNAFLSMMEGALSGKTGFTSKAGYCYVGALERDGKTFVVALLACGWPNHKTYKWSDTRELMEYGLKNYNYHSFAEAAYDESSLKPLHVAEGQTGNLDQEAYTGLMIAGRAAMEEMGYTNEGQSGEERHSVDEGQSEEERHYAEEDQSEEKRHSVDEGQFVEEGHSGEGIQGLLLREDEKIEVVCKMKDSLQAPVTSGTLVGMIYYMVEGEVYKTEQIVTADTVYKIDYKWCLRQIFYRYFV